MQVGQFFKGRSERTAVQQLVCLARELATSASSTDRLDLAPSGTSIRIRLDECALCNCDTRRRQLT